MYANIEHKNKPDTNNKLIYPELSYQLVGMLYDIHNELGNKYQEKYYQRAIAIELENRKVKFQKELPVNLMYKGKKIGIYFFDFLIENKIILEVKAVDKFRISDFKQISAYLKSKDLKLGIIANFRTEKLVYKRVLNPDFKYKK